MEEELSKFKFKMRMYIPDNASRSLVIPEKNNDKINYKIFTYLAIQKEDFIKIYNIVATIEDKEGQIEFTELKDTSKVIEIHGIKALNYDESIKLEEDYYNKLLQILPVLYSDSLLEDETLKVKDFINTFNELVVEDMQKLYEVYFPNFMNWIKKFK